MPISRQPCHPQNAGSVLFSIRFRFMSSFSIYRICYAVSVLTRLDYLFGLKILLTDRRRLLKLALPYAYIGLRKQKNYSLKTIVFDSKEPAGIPQTLVYGMLDLFCFFVVLGPITFNYRPFRGPTIAGIYNRRPPTRVLVFIRMPFEWHDGLVGRCRERTNKKLSNMGTAISTSNFISNRISPP